MLTWQTDHQPLADSVIAGAEMILGVQLPVAYRTLSQRYPGARIDVEEPEDVSNAEGRWSACVGAFLSLDPRHGDNVFEYLQSEGLPPGLLPFADDGGGNLLCLDYRHSAEVPAVVFWAHELDGEEALVRAADSFDAFLAILEAENAR